MEIKYRQAGKTKLKAGTRKGESRRSHGAASRERHAETLLVGHEPRGKL